MKEWFEGQCSAPRPINYRPWWLDVLIGVGCAFAVALIIGELVGRA